MSKIEYALSIYPFQIDAMGHVNNIIYVQWMEIGRTKLMDAIEMPVDQVIKEGFAPVLVETNISYEVPLYLSDQVTASIWLSQLRSASAVMSFEFCNQHGQVAAAGTQRGLFIDLESKKPKRLDKKMRDRFVRYLITDT
ncbi:MAG: thioesterase family protein [Cyanobacteria bacterium P01_D01_bin.36]